MKNPTFSGWEVEELEGRKTEQSGREKIRDEIEFIAFINMAVIDNLYFGVPGWDFGFQETGSYKYGLL